MSKGSFQKSIERCQIGTPMFDEVGADDEDNDDDDDLVLAVELGGGDGVLGNRGGNRSSTNGCNKKLILS